MKQLKRVVIAGGIGGGQIAASMIEDINDTEPTWELAGFLNDGMEVGEKMGEYPVIGKTEEVTEYVRKGYYIHYAMHNTKYGSFRMKRFLELGIPDEAFATIVHPLAYTKMNRGIGAGSLVCPFVGISYGAKVGNHSHLYINAFIGHDSEVGNFVSVANNAAVGSHVVIKDAAHLGTNCSLREDLTIGQAAIVGLGAVVLKSVGDGEIAVGNPSKIIGTIDQYQEG